MTDTETMTLPTPTREDWDAPRLAAFLAEKSRTIHFVGIGGCGMSGLAKLLLARGHRVQGSDLEENFEVQRLQRRGVVIRQGHAHTHLGTPDLVVHTTAATADNPERRAAEEQGLPCLRRARMLAALMHGHVRSFAVAGIHGKTTTSAMLTHILQRANLAPGFCIGAHIPILGENAAAGAGKYFVAEADESDGSLTEYAPTDALILNLEPEHMDHFGKFEAMLELFRQFATRATHNVFYCAEDEHATRICADLPRTTSFGLGPNAQVRAANLHQEGFSTSFDLVVRGQTLGRIALRIPGAQNASNAAGAAAAALAAGATCEQIATALSEFTGAARRFECKLNTDDYIVIDDYAHHPTEIRATLEAVRGLKRKRILVAFQPHRYSRTQLLRAEFGQAFPAADRLLLTDVYAASETPIPGVSGLTIYEAVKANGQSGVTYEPTLEKLTTAILAEARRGDVIVILGAGDITKISCELATRLRGNPLPHFNISQDNEEKCFGDLCEILSNRAVIKRNEPLSHHTSFKVGGLAQFWVEPDHEKDLSKLLRYCGKNRVPYRFFGRGSNLLIADKGVSGVVICLNHTDFCQLKFDAELIRAGAGVRLRQLVNEAKRRELTGLEFMEGIPASLGGALRMNAGAMGASTFERVESVRIMNAEGQIFDRTARELQPTYRSCEALKPDVALAATLRTEHGSREEMELKMAEYFQKRKTSQPAVPSAGCIFKNPESVPAGKLIDELGLKGRASGGARISTVHGNFIVNEGGATAADVMKLIALVKDTARRERHLELETEVEIWGSL